MQAAQEFERAKQYLTVFSKFKELLICFELKSNKMSISTLPSLMNISLSYDQKSTSTQEMTFDKILPMTSYAIYIIYMYSTFVIQTQNPFKCNHHLEKMSLCFDFQSVLQITTHCCYTPKQNYGWESFYTK